MCIESKADDYVLWTKWEEVTMVYLKTISQTTTKTLAILAWFLGWDSTDDHQKEA
jgi:hypothetical protein